jgi:hypothetical protein
MKSTFKQLGYVAIIAGLLFSAASCKKDDDAGIPPQISFRTGSNSNGVYNTQDASVARGSTQQIGIIAAKSEPNDILKTFSVAVSIDGRSDSTLSTTALTAAQGDQFTTDYPVTTRNVSGTEKYTFTVVNRDGITNSISIKFTTP